MGDNEVKFMSGNNDGFWLALWPNKHSNQCNGLETNNMNSVYEEIHGELERQFLHCNESLATREIS